MNIELNTFPINFAPETIKFVFSRKKDYRFCNQESGKLFFTNEKIYNLLNIKLRKFGISDSGLNMLLFLLEFTHLDYLFKTLDKTHRLDTGLVDKHIDTYRNAIVLLEKLNKGYGLYELSIKLYKDENTPTIETFNLNGNLLINDIRVLLFNHLSDKIGIKRLKENLDGFQKMKNPIKEKYDLARKHITIRLYSSIFKSLLISLDSHRFIIIGYLLYFNGILTFNEIKRSEGMTDKDLRDEIFALDNEIDNQDNDKPKLYDYELNFRNNIKKRITSAKNELQQLLNTSNF